MATNELVRKYDLSPEELERRLQEALSSRSPENIGTIYEDSVKSFEAESILKGRVINVVGDDVMVDVGYKSEGVIPLQEFDDPSVVVTGAEVEVYLESIEDEAGAIVLSKRKADRIRGWERIISSRREGDVVKGRVVRKIKGGLLVDIGVPVFLPASQVGIRRTTDISEYIGQEVEGKIIKIDEERMNIVISRRKMIEEERDRQKRKLLEEIAEGQIRTGEVKNIADFGAFVDLGGIDGLLHITDMSWGRIGHPSEMLSIGDKIEVKVLKVDRERERIALGLKQKTENPWHNIEQKYPIGSRVKGRVVNIMNYGAFVKLEEGVEGLVHVSEMSWTKRINHPSEVVQISDVVEVMVLDINKGKQEISLGMKQVETNPWSLVEQKYPPGTLVSGKVRNMTNYGAFVELEEGIDGLLHISDMSWTKKVGHPSKLLKKGEEIKAVVLSVDQEKKRIALGLKQLEVDPWTSHIPEKYVVGMELVGTVTKLTNFGVFVELEKDLEGLLHISELGRHVKSPEEVLKVGDTVQVRVIKIDPDERKIGLSLVRGGGLLTTEEPTEVAPVSAGGKPGKKKKDKKGRADRIAEEEEEEIDPSYIEQMAAEAESVYEEGEAPEEGAGEGEEAAAEEAPDEEGPAEEEERS